MNPRNPYEIGSNYDIQPSVVEQAHDRRRPWVWLGRIGAAAVVVGLSANYLAHHDLPDVLHRDHYIAPQDPTQDMLGIPSNEDN